ncbi:hypothetical protein GNF98_21240 [Clostridium perfringens]
MVCGWNAHCRLDGYGERRGYIEDCDLAAWGYGRGYVATTAGISPALPT